MKILPVFLFCLPLFANAEIYRWQDGDGSAHFSDRSHPQAKVIDIKPGYGYYRIKKVYDGDTVELADGRKIRLLGINTPEIRHKNNSAEPGGDEAKQWLTNKLADNKVRLVTDIEKNDKYGRTLAHLFTESKEHINLLLVESGLASVNIYPPNLLYADALIKAQDKAEYNKTGIWQQQQYQVIADSSLGDRERAGWVRIQGNVTGIRQSRKFVYLQFSSQFEARIERQWLSLFPDVDTYLGKTIEVRGWLTKNRGRIAMLIRHPGTIRLK